MAVLDVANATPPGAKAPAALTQAKIYLLGGRREENHLHAIEIPAEEQGQWEVGKDFIDALHGVAPVRLTSFEDGVRFMEFTEAVFRSRQTGRAVALPLFAP